MGYDLHITRQENWFDDENSLKISQQQWEEYIANDPEMKLEGFAQVILDTGEVVRIENNGIAVWLKYSGEGLGQNHAWFTLYNGNIGVKNPDQEIINKMVEISIFFNGKVQGDEGELYEIADYLDKQTLKEVTVQGKSNKKPWWKIW